MVSEWRRVSRNSRLLNLTVAGSAFFFIESDAPGTERSVQLQLSFNDNWETSRPLKRAYLNLCLDVDYGRDAYLRLRN